MMRSWWGSVKLNGKTDAYLTFSSQFSLLFFETRTEAVDLCVPMMHLRSASSLSPLDKNDCAQRDFVSMKSKSNRYRGRDGHIAEHRFKTMMWTSYCDGFYNKKRKKRRWWFWSLSAHQVEDSFGCTNKIQSGESDYRIWWIQCIDRWNFLRIQFVLNSK